MRHEVRRADGHSLLCCTHSIPPRFKLNSSMLLFIDLPSMARHHVLPFAYDSIAAFGDYCWFCTNKENSEHWSTIGIQTQRTKLFTGNFIPADTSTRLATRFLGFDYVTSSTVKCSRKIYTSEDQSHSSGTALYISSVPYPCPKWGVLLRDHRAEAPLRGRSIKLRIR
jgi:hypothetical protein